MIVAASRDLVATSGYAGGAFIAIQKGTTKVALPKLSVFIIYKAHLLL
ncbi:hypothetical protein QIW31_01770 [Francisellaceae bacterium CB299]